MQGQDTAPAEVAIDSFVLQAKDMSVVYRAQAE